MPTLFYVHDPMCSWCYAFAPTWRQIRAALPETVDPVLLVGGLAPDSAEPMPQPTRRYIQDTWRRIQAVVPGTAFNFDFWSSCTPRRSTYPACRAVLAARELDPALEWPMIEAIQRAYYREARNPSDMSTLGALAAELGMNEQAFCDWCDSDAGAAALAADIQRARALGVFGFPSLVLQTDRVIDAIPHEFGKPDVTLAALRSAMRE